MMEVLAMGGYAGYVWSSFGITLLVLIICVVQSRARHRTPAQIQALQAAANKAVQAGDVPAAIQNFEQLLTFDPNNADILSNLGKLHYMSGNLDAATEMFAKASGVAPEMRGSGPTISPP